MCWATGTRRLERFRRLLVLRNNLRLETTSRNRTRNISYGSILDELLADCVIVVAMAEATSQRQVELLCAWA